MPRIEVPVNRDLSALAPAVKHAVERVLAGMKADGFNAIQYDTIRSADRSNFLYGKGRTPEQCLEVGISAVWGWPTCPDGKVTNATYGFTWHNFGLACDIVENDATPWTAPQAFWHNLSVHAIQNSLVWGGSWTRFPDLPHVQWNYCPRVPTDQDRLDLAKGDLQAVWRRYQAA